jgi:DNA-binding MarR family transcriptional regulator
MASMAGDNGELAVLLAMAYRAMTDGLHAHLTEAGHDPALRPAHGFAFLYLSHRSGTTAVELAGHLGVTKQAAGQLVDELARLGYVTRTRHPTDRRARAIQLTDRGWACIREVIRYWELAERRWADTVGADTLDTVRTALRGYLADTTRPVKPAW